MVPTPRCRWKDLPHGWVTKPLRGHLPARSPPSNSRWVLEGVHLILPPPSQQLSPLPAGAHPASGSMCPPQAQAEVGPTMTEKAQIMACAPSPEAPSLPPKSPLPGPLHATVVEEGGHRDPCSPPRLPPGVPVISLGHTRPPPPPLPLPPGAAMPPTELSAFPLPLLQLSTLGAAPPALSLHYHPHPFLNRSVPRGGGCGTWGIRVHWGPRGVSDPQLLTASTLGQQEPSLCSPTAG